VGLHHVAKRPCGFVEGGAAFDPNRLRRRDFHMIDKRAVPNWLDHAVAQAKN